MKTSLAAALLAVADRRAAVRRARRSAAAEALRAVRTVELRYDKAQETNRYFGTVQARHEVDQAFRVGGKVVRAQGRRRPEGARRATCSRCSTTPTTGSPSEAAHQQLVAARRAGAAGRVGSAAPGGAEERRLGQRVRRRESAEQARRRRAPPPRPRRSKLELARNRLEVHGAARIAGAASSPACASRSARSWPKASRSSRSPKEGEPEIVVDVPEDHLAAFKASRYKAIARERARPDVRRRAARAVAAGGRADAHVPRAPEARDAARRCRSARPRRSSSSAPVGGRAGGRDPGRRDHAEQGPARGVGRASRGHRAGRHRRPARASRCTAIATTRCSSPGRRPASWSSPPACRRWRRACASRCPARRRTQRSTTKQAAR